VTNTLKGIALATGGAALLTLNDAVSKHLVASYPLGQVICLRQAATLLVIVPYVRFVTGWASLRVVSWPGQLTRGLLFVGGSAFMVSALGLLPLATVITLVFVSPTFVAAFSGPLLGERVSVNRWFAILVGFAGVVIVVRPGASAFQWALLLPVACAFINALRDIMTRRLARTETSVAILFWSTVIVMTVALATAPFGWEPLTGSAVMWFVAVGVFNAGAHFLLIEGLRLAEASVVAPVRYTAIVWATLIGFVVWGEVPDAWVLIGALVIIASGLYTVRGESRPKIKNED
jgi:drug/metabolite transporter (DMT)-like permease